MRLDTRAGWFTCKEDNVELHGRGITQLAGEKQREYRGVSRWCFHNGSSTEEKQVERSGGRAYRVSVFIHKGEGKISVLRWCTPTGAPRSEGCVGQRSRKKGQ